ncbi:MAG: DMT family transporter, partial [Rhodospirillaceae bacterium]
AIAIAGEALLIFGRQGHSGEATLAGDLLVVAATVSAALGYMAGSRLSRQIGSWATTAWGITLAGALMLPFLLWMAPGTDWAAVPAPAWGGLAYIVVLTTVVGYASWYWAMAAAGIVRVAPVQYLQPLVALVLAVIVFSETMTLRLAIAAALILAGVALARKG